MRFFIRQIKNKDCAFACLKMLLVIKSRCTDYLYLEQRKDDVSYSFLDIINIANREGVHLEAYKCVDKKEIIGYKNLPLMILFREFDSLHMVLLLKITKKYAKIADPKRGIYKMKIKEFLEKWNFEFIESTDKRISKPKYKIKNIRTITYTLPSLFFHILSFISLSIGFYLSNAQSYFFMPLVAFSLFAIFEFINQRLLLRNMKKFDKKVIRPCFENNNINAKKTLNDLTLFKRCIFANPIILISSILISFLILIMLGINSWISIYNIILITIISTIFYIFETKYVDSEKKNLEKLEHDIFLSRKENIVLSSFDNLCNKNYQIVSYINFKKYFIIFIIFVLVMFQMGFSNQISLNFLIFNVFMLNYFNENYGNILSFNKEREEFKYFKCLYLNYVY